MKKYITKVTSQIGEPMKRKNLAIKTNGVKATTAENASSGCEQSDSNQLQPTWRIISHHDRLGIDMNPEKFQTLRPDSNDKIKSLAKMLNSEGIVIEKPVPQLEAKPITKAHGLQTTLSKGAYALEIAESVNLKTADSNVRGG